MVRACLAAIAVLATAVIASGAGSSRTAGIPFALPLHNSKDCELSYALDWGDGTPNAGGALPAGKVVVVRHVYRVPGRYTQTLEETYAAGSDPAHCYWSKGAAARYFTKNTMTVLGCYGGTCRILDRPQPSLSRPRPRVAPPPADVLPRPGGGVIVPVLPGGAHYGDELALVPVWGTSSAPCQCSWESGENAVAIETVLRAKKSSTPLITSVSVSSFSHKDGKSPNTAAASHSRLKAWRTSTSVHVGMTWTDAKKRYPHRLHCSRPRPGLIQGCVFQTAPYRLSIDGQARRQVFTEYFRRHIPGVPLVNEVGAILAGDEGRCEVGVNMDEDVAFVAFCWGPLKSARFEFNGPGRLLNLDTQRNNEIFFAIDDNGDDVTGALWNSDELDVRKVGPGSVVWTTICERFSQPPKCFPDRPAMGTPGIWPSGTFEAWRLQFAGQSRPILKPAGFRPPMPEFTFTAEFVGMPKYTFRSTEQGTSR